MALTRRTLLFASLAAPAAAGAEAPYPTRPIRLVLPFPPGGGPDVLTRHFLPRISALLGQTIYGDNKVGAGGIVAAEHVAQQPPDGYTLLLGNSTQLTQKLLQPKARFDPLNGFTPVMRLSYTPSLLVVGARSPYRSLDDLVNAARAEPGRLNYGSGGIGSAAHLAGAALASETRIAVTHIPYRGSVDLPQAVVGGDVQFAVPTISTVLPLLQGERLRALAITSAERDPTLPEVPTLKELTGSDDLVQVAWGCLWLPGGAPETVVRTLFDALTKAYSDPELVKASAAQGITISLSRTPAEFAAFVAAENAKVTRLIRVARIEPT